jgi:hypothetical protein
MLFSAKGGYTLQATYSKSGRQAISNSVTFVVNEPTEADREVFEAIRTDAALIEATSSAPVQAHAKKRLEKYPASPYLRRTRIKLLSERAAALQNRLDPDTGGPVSLDKRGDDLFKAQKVPRDG